MKSKIYIINIVINFNFLHLEIGVDKVDTTNNSSNIKLYSILGVVLAVLLLMVAIFVFIFVYRRYYRPKDDNSRRTATETTAIPDSEEGNIYEETEYQSVPERSGSNSSDISQQQQPQTYEDLNRSSFKTHISQSSRFSSTKSNTYQGLIGNGGTEQSVTNDSDDDNEDDDNIYAYIDEQATTTDDNNHLKPGTSFNLFKRSLEDLKQDSSNMEKNNFSSYVTVSDKTRNNNMTESIELATPAPHIYKTPSSVPKFMPPGNVSNNNEAKGVYEVNVRTISAENSGSGSPLYEDILHT